MPNDTAASQPSPVPPPLSGVQRFIHPTGGQSVAPGAGEQGQPEVQRLVPLAGGKSVTARDEATSAIRELAERQHGVVAWRQLVALGLSPRLIESRVKRGRLLPVHRGVFALGHCRIGLYGEWMAAVLACGPGAVLSYGSAAQLWGLRGSRKPIEVTRVAGHRRPHGIRLHQTRSLPDEHRTIEAGIPVTSLERTLLDMAARLDQRQLEHDLVAADRSRRLRWPELNRIVTEHGSGRRGVRRFKRLIERVDPRFADAVSPSEIDFLALCQREGLPLPQVNVLVEGKRVDFYWPRERLVIESDSYDYHGDRLAFERDHQSTVDLQVAGYRVLRTTYKMLQSNPGPLLRLAREALAS